MRYSNNLLKRYISLDVEPELIQSQLTLKVCEVEEMHIRALPSLVVIWKVTATRPHPNADKLTVCTLDCGDKWTYQICTGGENVLADTYVPVALPGCFLPAINLLIEPREMRGEPSNGMICSKQEIGIPEDLEEHWIWTLQYGAWIDLATVPQKPDMDDITDKDLWRELGDKYPWLHNRMAEVDNKTITHRPDLFGHFGMSIELDALFPGQSSFSTGKKYMEQIKHHNIFELLTNATQTIRSVKIDSKNVNAYTLLEINNITIQPSDLYLRTHLYDLGIQPKNNWVDLSNLFMYLTSQPVHFFDAKKIDWDIVVRQAKKWEVFVDLLWREHQLQEIDIVIADDKKVLALGGVIGGMNSCIDEQTTDILVEIANFDSVNVRKTWTRLSLRTDAELRFEKNINPLYTLHTAMMFLDELKYFAKSLGNYTYQWLARYINETLKSPVIKKIPLDTLRVERLLFGLENEQKEVLISDESISTILTSLGCEINADREITIPARRGPEDITTEIDLIEEIARIYWFENIPTKPYLNESKFVPFSPQLVMYKKLEDLLQWSYEFDQAETYPWIDQRRIDLYQLPTQALYSMENPLVPQRRFLRNRLLWNLLELVEKNAPFFDTIKLFDIGKTWELWREKPEQDVLGVIYWKKEIKGWEESGVLYLKGVIAGIAADIPIKGKREYQPTQENLSHPLQQANILLNKQLVGTIQTLHPYKLQMAKLPTQWEIVVAEISLSKLLEITANQNRSTTATYETIQDQRIWRDINFVIDKTMWYGAISQAVQKVNAISDVALFDLYAWSRLPENKKSIGLRVKITWDGSLKTDQINDIVAQAVKAVETIGGELRK